VAEEAGSAEVAVILRVILDRVEHHGQARELAAQRHRSLDAVHRAGELHIHEHRGGERFGLRQPPGERLLAAGAGVQHRDLAGGGEAAGQRRGQARVVFDDQEIEHSGCPVMSDGWM